MTSTSGCTWVFRTPDDGCKEHPKHVEKSCSEIKYRLLSVASRWKLIYIRLVMHGTMNVKYCLLQYMTYSCWRSAYRHRVDASRSYRMWDRPKRCSLVDVSCAESYMATGEPPPPPTNSWIGFDRKCDNRSVPMTDGRFQLWAESV
jgi:hypothetical protein